MAVEGKIELYRRGAEELKLIVDEAINNLERLRSLAIQSYNLYMDVKSEYDLLNYMLWAETIAKMLRDEAEKIQLRIYELRRLL